MKSYEETISIVLERAEQYRIRQKQKKKIQTKIDDLTKKITTWLEEQLKKAQAWMDGIKEEITQMISDLLLTPALALAGI